MQEVERIREQTRDSQFIESGKIGSQGDWNESMNDYKQQNQVNDFKSKSQGRNISQTTLTNVCAKITIRQLCLKENPLNAFFLKLFKLFHHGFPSRVPNRSAMFKMTTD